MRTTQLLIRSSLTAAAAAALPLSLATPPVAAWGSGISVIANGSTVSVTTSACGQVNGSFGNASLLSSGQTNFSQGRQVALSGTSSGQSAAWSNVNPGTFTVIVVCANGSTAGTQAIVVSGASSPTISATASPSPSPSASASASRGVMGGLGGSVRHYGTATLVGGGVLVTAGTVATAWYLRRRAKPHRF